MNVTKAMTWNLLSHMPFVVYTKGRAQQRFGEQQRRQAGRRKDRNTERATKEGGREKRGESVSFSLPFSSEI